MREQLKGLEKSMVISMFCLIEYPTLELGHMLQIKKIGLKTQITGSSLQKY